MQMSNRIDAARLLPIVMGVALGSALLAALALLLSGRTAGDLVRKREQTAELAALSQNMPLQAGAAVRGSAPAFDALADSRLRLDARARGKRARPGFRQHRRGLDRHARAVAVGARWARSCAQGAAGRRGGARAHATAPHRAREYSQGLRSAAAGISATVRALRASCPGGRPGSVGARGRHRAGRGGIAPPDRQPRLHGPRHGRTRRRAQRARHRARAARRVGRRSPPFHRLPERAGPGARSDRARRPARADAGGAQRAGRERHRALRRARGLPAVRRRHPGLACAPLAAAVLHHHHPACARLCRAPATVARQPAARPPISRPARTSGTSRPSCGCSTSCRAWPTAT